MNSLFSRGISLLFACVLFVAAIYTGADFEEYHIRNSGNHSGQQYITSADSDIEVEICARKTMQSEESLCVCAVLKRTVRRLSEYIVFAEVPPCGLLTDNRICLFADYNMHIMQFCGYMSVVMDYVHQQDGEKDSDTI